METLPYTLSLIVTQILELIVVWDNIPALLGMDRSSLLNVLLVLHGITLSCHPVRVINTIFRMF